MVPPGFEKRQAIVNAAVRWTRDQEDCLFCTMDYTDDSHEDDCPVKVYLESTEYDERDINNA